MNKIEQIQSEIKMLKAEIACKKATIGELLIFRYAVDKELELRGIIL